jgi:hypothetical protein
MGMEREGNAASILCRALDRRVRAHRKRRDMCATREAGKMEAFWKEFFGFCGKIGPYVVSLFGVYLGWKLSRRSEARQRYVDNLKQKFAALSQIRAVIDDIPPGLDGSELFTKLDSDDDFCGTLVIRLTRLFGLRNELIPYIDSSFVQLIDQRFKPLFVIQTGTYTFRMEKKRELAAFLAEVSSLVPALEIKLTEDYEKEFKHSG